MDRRGKPSVGKRFGYQCNSLLCYANGYFPFLRKPEMTYEERRWKHRATLSAWLPLYITYRHFWICLRYRIFCYAVNESGIGNINIHLLNGVKYAIWNVEILMRSASILSAHPPTWLPACPLVYATNDWNFKYFYSYNYLS